MTYTKGNVIVENIKLGDIHYEYEYGCGIKSEVISLPIRDETGFWTWESKSLKSGEISKYGVREGCSQYASNLYDHEAYIGVKYFK